MLFGNSYAQWIGYVLTVVLIILFGLPNGFLKRFEKYYSHDHLHTEIAQGGTSVFLNDGKGEEGQREKLSPREAEQFIGWFNEARLVQKVQIPAEYRRGSVIHITTGTDEHIEIVPYRNDFAVRRVVRNEKVKPVEYWAKQDDITQFFQQAHSSGKQGLC